MATDPLCDPLLSDDWPSDLTESLRGEDAPVPTASHHGSLVLLDVFLGRGETLLLSAPVMPATGVHAAQGDNLDVLIGHKGPQVGRAAPAKTDATQCDAAGGRGPGGRNIAVFADTHAERNLFAFCAAGLRTRRDMATASAGGTETPPPRLT